MTEQRIFNFNNTKNFFEENLIRDTSNSNVLNFLESLAELNLIVENKNGNINLKKND